MAMNLIRRRSFPVTLSRRTWRSGDWPRQRIMAVASKAAHRVPDSVYDVSLTTPAGSHMTRNSFLNSFGFSPARRDM